MNMQGRYISDGNNKVIKIPQGADSFEIMNETRAAAGGAGTLVKCSWQTGQTYGFGQNKLAADDSLTLEVLDATNMITYVDSTTSPLKAKNETVTTITNAATPVVTLTDTTGIATGSVVRLSNITGARQLDGIDFTVGTVVLDTSFPLQYMAQIDAATTGALYPVRYDSLFYPRNRYISEITKATNAVITFTVTHGYVIGDVLRIMVPEAFGMKEMNMLYANITDIDLVNNTVTVDIDSTTFTTFAWPTTTDVMPIFAQALPLSPSLKNDGFIGFEVVGGAAGINGADADVISWKANVVDRAY